MATSAVYVERKLLGLCTRCGKTPAAPDSNECVLHQAERRATQATATRKRRRARRRRRQCVMCSRKSRGSLCGVCSTKHAMVRAPEYVSIDVSHGRLERIAARTKVEYSGEGTRAAGTRVRYHGQDGRGPIPREVSCRKDLLEARGLIDRAIIGYDAAHAVEDAPKAERKAAVEAALGVADHGVRFVLSVFERHGYESEGLHGE